MPDPLALLGLARKAGRLALGEAAAEQAVRRGEAVLLLVAGDAGSNAVRQAERRAAAAGLELIALPRTKAQFGRAMGRETAAVAALTDEGFAAALRKRLSEGDEPAT
jgi:ribosomal protein L7Ae-like RNA K-turn-binding protein